ncbi:hypothetical protein NP233_g694 [Leucocoprinus birnbaumii]|uniref:Nephrocystin 3-like N-terminal domain-containing protein n=1 Tax=Leucocoprinus birnbaumii TaxID=56174 RepID=A0AAD5W1D6_9AGAR|nr:hypothetical protein NP233_g694 [Leucocoprinus birnbaumii]
MPFFPFSRDIRINGGTFIDMSISLPTQNGMSLLLNACDPDAVYNPAARTVAPLCHPTARQKYIEFFIQWASPAFFFYKAPIPMIWMHGPAGVGKSSIAQTCVEHLSGGSIPCAAYFFSVNGRQTAGRLFPSIAHQLSLVYPQYRDNLLRRISDDPSLIQDKSLKEQFYHLILEPLRRTRRVGGLKRFRIPVFVDGLDECQDKDAQREIVEIVADSTLRHKLPLCWAFFSRPEGQIKVAFSGQKAKHVSCSFELRISRGDDGEIERFLRDGFEDILKERNIRLESPWPSDDEIRRLVADAAGLFHHARMVLRFVSRHPGFDLHTPLHQILDKVQGPSTLPFTELDAIYLMIMRNIPLDRLGPVLLVLTLLCLKESHFEHLKAPSVVLLSNTLGIGELEFKAICGVLSSVLEIKGSIKTTPYTRRNQSLPSLPRSRQPHRLYLTHKFRPVRPWWISKFLP